MGCVVSERVKFAKPTALPWVPTAARWAFEFFEGTVRDQNKDGLAEPKPRTHFGALALLLSATIGGLELVEILFYFHLKHDVRQRISNFIFDCGFPFSVLCLVVAFVGCFRPGRSRRLSLVAIGVLVLPWILGRYLP
jgi:hypothetical protein